MFLVRFCFLSFDLFYFWLGIRPKTLACWATAIESVPGSYFLKQSTCLCLFIGKLRTFIFKVIVATCLLIPLILLTSFLIGCNFFFLFSGHCFTVLDVMDSVLPIFLHRFFYWNLLFPCFYYWDIFFLHCTQHIYCNADLVIMNCFSLCLYWNDYSILFKDNFAGCSWLEAIIFTAGNIIVYFNGLNSYWWELWYHYVFNIVPLSFWYCFFALHFWYFDCNMSQISSSLVMFIWGSKCLLHLNVYLFLQM